MAFNQKALQVKSMKSKSSSPVVKHVSTEDIRHGFDQIRQFLEQARYRQAIGVLNELLASGLSLREQLNVLGCKGYVHALWRKPVEAIDDFSRLLRLVQAEIKDLRLDQIDWAHERAEDTGYLHFLAVVYYLRGTVRRAQQHFREAVEDLSLSLYMHAQPELQGLTHLHRAACLIQLEECPEQALRDLQAGCALTPVKARALLGLPEACTDPSFQIEGSRLLLRFPEGESQKLSTHFRLGDLKEDYLACAHVFLS
jgi:hypothetical protein